jgi:hypothetical protein
MGTLTMMAYDDGWSDGYHEGYTQGKRDALYLRDDRPG